MSDSTLTDKLNQGVVILAKRHSGDTHSDKECGVVDEVTTDKLMTDAATKITELEKELAKVQQWKEEQLQVESWWKELDSFVRNHRDARLGRSVSKTALGWLEERDELRALCVEQVTREKLEEMVVNLKIAHKLGKELCQESEYLLARAQSSNDRLRGSLAILDDSYQAARKDTARLDALAAMPIRNRVVVCERTSPAKEATSKNLRSCIDDAVKQDAEPNGSR